jgi:chromosome segregation ATPase
MQPVPVPEPDENLPDIKRIVENLEQGQRSIVTQADELRAIQQEMIQKLNSLPDAFKAATNTLQDRHTEVLSSRDASQRELDDLRKTNSDLQIQLTKARGAHGQVRVEKEALSEKIGDIERDRDQLRVQVKNLLGSNSTTAAQVVTLETRNSDLEEALAQALARLQASDVATQVHENRISELENTNHESASQNEVLKSKVCLKRYVCSV